MCAGGVFSRARALLSRRQACPQITTESHEEREHEDGEREYEDLFENTGDLKVEMPEEISEREQHAGEENLSGHVEQDVAAEGNSRNTGGKKNSGRKAEPRRYL